jgi:hypothetical protein
MALTSVDSVRSVGSTTIYRKLARAPVLRLSLEWGRTAYQKTDLGYIWARRLTSK